MNNNYNQMLSSNNSYTSNFQQINLHQSNMMSQNRDVTTMMNSVFTSDDTNEVEIKTLDTPSARSGGRSPLLARTSIPSTSPSCETRSINIGRTITYVTIVVFSVGYFAIMLKEEFDTD